MQERRPLAALTGSGGPAPPPGPSDSAAPVFSRTRRLALALAVAGVVVVVDQVTKSEAEAHLHRPVHLLGPLGLGLSYNSGSAFSLFSGHAPVLAAVAVALIAVLAWAAFRAPGPGVAIAVGLVLGGALGNLVDRVARGHGGAVVDFVTLTHWPTFNVADSCITVGVVLLAVLLWRGRTSGDASRPEAHRSDR